MQGHTLVPFDTDQIGDARISPLNFSQKIYFPLLCFPIMRKKDEIGQRTNEGNLIANESTISASKPTKKRKKKKEATKIIFLFVPRKGKLKKGPIQQHIGSKRGTKTNKEQTKRKN